MTDTIQDRLRNRGVIYAPSRREHKMLNEAADEIDRLERELAEAKDALREINGISVIWADEWAKTKINEIVCRYIRSEGGGDPGEILFHVFTTEQINAAWKHYGNTAGGLGFAEELGIIPCPKCHGTKRIITYYDHNMIKKGPRCDCPNNGWVVRPGASDD